MTRNTERAAIILDHGVARPGRAGDVECSRVSPKRSKGA
jgi:hypothetical protein